MKLKKHDSGLMTAVESTDKKLVPLFRRAVRRGTSKLEAMLAADAVSHDAGPPTYHCMARDQFIHGHNHLEAERVAAGDARPSDYQFFGNPLIVDPEGSGEDWESPSSRAAMGRHLVYTFEFDREGPAFLREQCRWALPLKDWAKSQFGRLYRDLKQFGDFRLMNVTYSGGKSLHIHIVFETALMIDRCKAEVSPAAVRAGYRAHWLRLHDVVMGHLQPSGGITPDDTLATSTALRRMPNGHRVVGDDHPLGLTPGSKVRQVVLWEQAVERNPAKEVFHSPSLFAAKPMRAKRGGEVARRALLTDAQLTYAEGWFQDFYGGTGLVLAGIEPTNDGYVARFHNSKADTNPASMLTEAFVTPILRGRDSERVGTLRPLPLRFGKMLDHLASEVDEAKGFDSAELAIARRRLGSFVPYWITGNDISLIHAAEGVGKSTSIMRHIDLSLTTGRLGQPSMFAFVTYDDAAMKAQQFNISRASAAGGKCNDEFIGVVWRSFSRLYSDIAGSAELLTVDDADEADASLWSLIQMRQPDVASAMGEELAAIWRKIEGRTPVLFTVHDAAHQWADNTFTRRMLCSDFFEDSFDPASSRARTELNWLVHDEVSISTFVDRFTDEEMRWLQGLRASGTRVWSSGGSKRQRAVYRKFADKDGGNCPVERADAQRALRAGLEAFEPIVISDAAEYGFQNHAMTPFGCEGQRYFIRCRDWWMEGERPVANRVMFLTTEIVPSLIARKAVPSLIYLRPTTSIGRDVIGVDAARRVNAENAPAIAQQYAGTGTWVIANKLDGAEHTISPFAVRGRNDLADADIVQIVTTFHPYHYRELQALGTWLGRDDLALLAHVDQINQSSGRNRGPRNNGASHKVYINLTLFRAIMGNAVVRDELRYVWRLEMDEVQRKNARARGNEPAGDENEDRKTA